ncbi:MAG: sigma-70 family RNA polymerase sigma factor [Acidobacteriota bacterium]
MKSGQFRVVARAVSRRMTARGARFPRSSGRQRRAYGLPCDLLQRCYRQRRGGVGYKRGVQREAQGRALRRRARPDRGGAYRQQESRGCRRGDGAWEELVDRYGKSLRRVVKSVLRSYSIPAVRLAAEDVVQEVYHQLLTQDGRRLRAFRGDRVGQTAAYLRRFAERVARQHVRGLFAEKRLRGVWAMNWGTAQFENLEGSEADMQERLLDRGRLQELLRCCVQVTPEATRQRDLQILYWAHGEGWDSQAIAEALGGGLSPGGVDSALFRLRHRLQQCGVSLGRRVSATGSVSGVHAVAGSSAGGGSYPRALPARRRPTAAA